MGTNAADGRDGESPTKEVAVGTFSIDKYPVTNSDFRSDKLNSMRMIRFV